MKYGYKKELPLSFEDAVGAVKKALSKEGFGVLSEMDVKKTLKKKLDVEHDNYVILGSCNPSFAYKALQTEKLVGLLLPCNVIAFEEGNKVFVASVLPTKVMDVVENEELSKIAEKVEKKLKKAINSI